jgi:hypothetical protein
MSKARDLADVALTYATKANFPESSWQSYVPVWGSNGTQPNLATNGGTISGKYIKIGKTVHYNIVLNLASGLGLGTGARYNFTLPLPNINSYPVATGFLFDSSANQYYPLLGRTSGASIDTPWWSLTGPNGLTGGAAGAATPVVPAAGDFYFFNGTYETSS